MVIGFGLFLVAFVLVASVRFINAGARARLRAAALADCTTCALQTVGRPCRRARTRAHNLVFCAECATVCAQRKLIRFMCSVFVLSWTGAARAASRVQLHVASLVTRRPRCHAGVIKYHGVIPAKRPNQIYVRASHRSAALVATALRSHRRAGGQPLDHDRRARGGGERPLTASHKTSRFAWRQMIILSQMNTFSVVGQKHVGWVGELQRAPGPASNGFANARARRVASGQRPCLSGLRVVRPRSAKRPRAVEPNVGLLRAPTRGLTRWPWQHPQPRAERRLQPPAHVP